MPSWPELGGPARAIGGAINAAVDAALTTDRLDFEPAAAAVAILPAEQAGLVLGTVVRLLLEAQHPGGLDSDDMREVLRRCYRAAIVWLPSRSVSVESLVAVLSSALGIHEPGVTYAEITDPTSTLRRESHRDERQDPKTSGESVRSEPPTSVEYAWHAPLLIADLLNAGGRRLTRYLDEAFGEIIRTETMELP